MAGVPQQTLTWLYNVLKREYQDPNRTYSDLAQTLAQYTGLSPRTEVYTSENGSPALLLNLKGVVPVNFRGTVYQFPIAIWVPQAYPYEGPIVYVTPTDGMVVRPGQHVSAADGRVYHHYLANWREAWDRSNVVELLRVLADIFAKEPPVAAKAQQQPMQQPPRQGGSTPVLPPAQDQQRYSNQPLPIGPARGGPPRPPPKQPTNASHSVSPAPQPPANQGRYDAPPPLPQSSQSPRPVPPPKPYSNGSVQQPVSGMQVTPQRQSNLRQEYPLPQQQQSSPTQFRPQSFGGYQQDNTSHSSLAARTGAYPGATQSPQAVAQSHQQYQQPIQQQAQQPPQQYPQNVPMQQPQLPYAQQPRTQQPSRSQPQQQPPQPPQSTAPKDLLSEDDPFQISLSSKSQQSDIPAPPIPINPEKTALLSHISHLILQRLHTSIQTTQQSALPSLYSQHQALTTAQQTLTTELQQLQSLSSQLQSNISALQSTITNGTQTIKSTQDPNHPSHTDNIPPIDQIIIPPTVVARQLYDAVAEQRGYEAAIFGLNEAFVRGRIGAEVWSRKVRECAREEMKRKWLVRKIGEGLGLEDGG